MPKLPHQHDRCAARMDDIASSLDAGLDANSILRVDSTALDDGFVTALAASEIDLDELDRRVLDAAENSGSLPAALRERAEAHRFTGALQRSVVTSMLYPFCVIVVASVVFSILATVNKNSSMPVIWFWAPLAIIFGGIYFVVRRARIEPNFDAKRIPVLGKILSDLGELPYLAAILSLYRAGIPIHEAHDQATGASPVAHTRDSLGVATHAMRGGSDYSTALALAAVIDPETLQLVTNGERAGNLEESFERAVSRRRDVLERRIKRAAKVGGAMVYAFAVMVAVYVIFSFYADHYAAIGRIRR